MADTYLSIMKQLTLVSMKTRRQLSHLKRTATTDREYMAILELAHANSALTRAIRELWQLEQDHIDHSNGNMEAHLVGKIKEADPEEQGWDWHTMLGLESAKDEAKKEDN